MMLRLILILFVLLAIAAVLVVQLRDFAGIVIGATVLAPIIFVIQLIVGRLCLCRFVPTQTAEDESNET